MTHILFSFAVTDPMGPNTNQLMPGRFGTDSLAERHRFSNQAQASESSFGSVTVSLRHFQCSYCPSICTTKYELQSHVLICHSQHLPYVCSLCGKGYHTASGLALHRQVHEGRSFPCPLCPSRFSQKGKVKRHLQNIHDATQCSTCSGIFRRGEEYDRHVLICHGS